MNDIKALSVLVDLIGAADRMRVTSPVDDDYPRMRHEWESALERARIAVRHNGTRLEDIAANAPTTDIGQAFKQHCVMCGIDNDDDDAWINFLAGWQAAFIAVAVAGSKT